MSNPNYWSDTTGSIHCDISNKDFDLSSGAAWNCDSGLVSCSIDPASRGNMIYLEAPRIGPNEDDSFSIAWTAEINYVHVVVWWVLPPIALFMGLVVCYSFGSACNDGLVSWLAFPKIKSVVAQPERNRGGLYGGMGPVIEATAVPTAALVTDEKTVAVEYGSF